MNSSEVESSDSNSHDRVSFEQIQGIWNNIKKAKESSALSHHDKSPSSKRQSIASVKKAIEQQQQINIETRLVLTQKQLKKSKQNTNLLLKKLSQAQQQIQYLEYELDKQLREKQQQQQEIQSLKYSLQNQEKEYSKQLSLNSKDVEHQAELESMRRSLMSKERQVDKLSLKIKSLQMTNSKLQKEMKVMSDNVKIYEKRLESINNQQSFFNQNNPSFLNIAQNKGSQLLELEQAYNIIQRLAILLKSTQDYRNFEIPLEEIKNHHFLKNITQRMRKGEIPLSNKASNSCAKHCHCMEIRVDERLLWTPSLCYKKLLELKIKYNSNLTESCIEELLFEMNKIYTSRQQTNIKKIEQSYETKIKGLRNKSQPRYDELIARKQIERLKKQLQTERYSKSNSTNKCDLRNNLDILKSIGQYEDELKLKQKEVILLKQRISLIQNQNHTYDKILYLEGTLWVLDKVLLEVQNNTQDLHDFESSFRQRISQEMSHQDWINSFKYFFENINENQNSLIEKILLMKESTLNKINNRRNAE